MSAALAETPRIAGSGPRAVRLERARGAARLSVNAVAGVSRVAALYQSGAAKIRLTRRPPTAPVEAVLLNTAGGVTGGDRLSAAVTVGPAARLVVTSQAAERIYRRFDGVGEIANAVTVGPAGRLDWLPQETIVFDRSAASRRFEADVAGDATLLAAEAVILGRTAMGETVRSAAFADAWRIRRGGALVFADAVRLDGDPSRILAGPATGGGAVAFATLLLVAPEAEAQLEIARAALEDDAVEAGASAWNGILVCRLVAGEGQALRRALVRLVETLRGAPMPRAWSL